jgi:hypothetical protein
MCWYEKVEASVCKKISFLHFYFALTERVRLNEKIRWNSARTVQAKLSLKPHFSRRIILL